MGWSWPVLGNCKSSPKLSVSYFFCLLNVLNIQSSFCSSIFYIGESHAHSSTSFVLPIIKSYFSFCFTKWETPGIKFLCANKKLSFAIIGFDWPRWLLPKKACSPLLTVEITIFSCIFCNLLSAASYSYWSLGKLSDRALLWNGNWNIFSFYWLSWGLFKLLVDVLVPGSVI